MNIRWHLVIIIHTPNVQFTMNIIDVLLELHKTKNSNRNRAQQSI